MVSNRPDTLKIIQTSSSLTYQASEPIQSITYGGKSPAQQNSIQLNGLPPDFSLTLGDTLGSANPHNVLKACVNGLRSQVSPKLLSSIRGKKISEIISKREHKK